MEKYDFSGWATKNNLKCSDGRIIMKDAFKHIDVQTVTLVWNHNHDCPADVIGHALLENRENGVYAYCFFNNTTNGDLSKVLVKHGDIQSLSIYANKLKQQGANVMHGEIREVSLVHAGANPGACIDSVIMHADGMSEVLDSDEAVIYTGEDIALYHSDKQNNDNKDSNETIGDIFESLSEKQQNAVYAMMGEIIEQYENQNDEEDEEEGDESMKHNVFDNETNKSNKLAHSDIEAIFTDAKKSGSLRDTVESYGIDLNSLEHSVTNEAGQTVNYGIANIDYLFPDAKNVNTQPDFIKRNTDWVAKVMNSSKHLPFSRVKTTHADITMDEARAKGYVKGKEKTHEVFALLKRSTTPTTIYKKQKLDRDDVIDIVDFDVVYWLRQEMRLMLDEEIARAALIGDGRLSGTDDKISEDNIRPIWKDDKLYTVRKEISLDNSATDEDKAKTFIRTIIKSRKEYKGSGNPTLFTTEDMLTDCLLIEDGNGRVIYDSLEKLKTALRVSDIVTVQVMENQKRTDSSVPGYDFNLMGIVVNMQDYAFGADKGGSINMFDDFDIDFNQLKYLIETRCSGALIKPYSAIVIEQKTAQNAG